MAKVNKRLLKEKEVNEIYEQWKALEIEAGHGQSLRMATYVELIAKAQDAKTRKETRKEVGEWLDGKMTIITANLATHYDIRLEDVDALKNGEMPK